jgi:hypothetical protein
MENFVRIPMLPPEFVPKMPQVMILQKLNQRNRGRRPPCFVGQAQRAQQREGEDCYLRENSYFHVEPCRDCRLDADEGFEIPHVTPAPSADGRLPAPMENATALVAFGLFALFLL